MSVHSKMTAIADAIREKTGGTGTLTLDQMAEEIAGLEIGETVPEVELATPTISINADGTVVASITQEAGYTAGGTKTARQTQNTQAAQTIIPGTEDQSIPAYRYLTGEQTIKGDANLIPENIVSGVSIFGVEGTAETGGGGESAQWITVATSLPNEMYLLGDVNQDGSVTVDDANAVMEIAGVPEADWTAFQIVLGDVNFNGNLNHLDAMTTNEISQGTRPPAFTYATAVEYADAAVGDHVNAVFTDIATSSGTTNVPTYAYVVRAGVIGIYSNVKIPAGSAGEIKLLKNQEV